MSDLPLYNDALESSADNLPSGGRLRLSMFWRRYPIVDERHPLKLLAEGLTQFAPMYRWSAKDAMNAEWLNEIPAYMINWYNSSYTVHLYTTVGARSKYQQNKLY